jgi:hypothetical protein
MFSDELGLELGLGLGLVLGLGLGLQKDIREKFLARRCAPQFLAF